MKKFIVALVALAAMAFGSTSTDMPRVCGAAPTFDDGEVAGWGSYGVDVDGNCTMGAIAKKDGSNLASTDGDESWAIANYDIDPFFNWTFTTNMNGVHNVIFNMPFIGGAYNQIALSASGTLTPGGKAVTAKNISVTSSLNGAATAQVINLADTTIAPPFSGTVPAVNNLANILTPAAGLYGVIVSFEHAGTGSVTINGRIELLNTVVPEPATFALIGTALLGLGFVARRRA